MAGQVTVGMRRAVLSSIGLIGKKADASIERVVASCIAEANGDKATLADLLVSACQPVFESYCDTSAVVASSYYDACSDIVGGVQVGAEPESHFSGALASDSRKAVERSIRNAVFGESLDGEGLISYLQKRARYEMDYAFNHSLDRAARKDTRDVRFARVTNGIESCNFCIMLASRGAAYTSAQNAGASSHYHSNCECVVTPVWDYKRSFRHQSASQTWDESLAKRRGGVWITDDVAGYSPYKELDRAYRIADETLSKQELDFAIVEYGLKKEDVILRAMERGVDLDSSRAMLRLAEAMYAGDDTIASNRMMSKYEESIVTSAINSLYKAKFEGVPVASIPFGDYAYLFRVIDFDDYEFLGKASFDE